MNVEDFKDIIYKKEENGILTLTINRPERKNAMSAITFLEIRTALDAAAEDDEIKVVILTGCEEANAYSSGVYFSPKMFKEMDPEIMKELDLNDRSEMGTCRKIFNFPKPLIAVINGLAIGAAFTMSLVGADLIYMADDAYIGFYFVNRALHAEMSSTFLLPFYVGFQRAKEIIFFGEKISPQEALDLRLVNKVLPREELMPFAREQALKLIAPKAPGMAIKMMKKSLQDFFREDIFNITDLENDHMGKLFKTKDFRISLNSLATKKEPVYKGR